MTPSSPKSPKCNGRMMKGRRLIVYAEVTLAKEGDDVGDHLTPLYCKDCGYIELYKK